MLLGHRSIAFCAFLLPQQPPRGGVLGAQQAEAPCIHTRTTTHLNVFWIHVPSPFPPPSAASQGALGHQRTRIPTAWVTCSTSITPAPGTSLSDARSGFPTFRPSLRLSKLLPSKHPRLTFALRKYSCVQHSTARTLAERTRSN